MKKIYLITCALFSLSALGAPSSLATRLDVLKALSTSTTASTSDVNYKMGQFIKDLDKALGGKAEKNTTYTLTQLKCDEKLLEVSCELMISIESKVDTGLGVLETFESSVKAKADFKRNDSKLILKSNKLAVDLAG